MAVSIRATSIPRYVTLYAHYIEDVDISKCRCALNFDQGWLPTDVTINRHGIRMGTSEVYAAVEALPEVMDSLVVDLEHLDRSSYMPLFVVLAPGL